MKRRLTYEIAFQPIYTFDSDPIANALHGCAQDDPGANAIWSDAYDKVWQRSEEAEIKAGWRRKE